MDTVTRPPRRLGSLDGLRALAVTAVVIYHIDDRILPGGFLGVDVFFVLSGYLITSLLVAENKRSGAIALRDFWKRRARRLWAAAWVVLALVALAGVWNLWGADRQAQLPGEIFAAVAHIENYWVLGHGGYLSQFAAPSPVRHFWSLAVEEQFYLVWPLVMIGGLAAVRRFGRAAMWTLLGVLAVMSLTAGLVVSPEQAYLGTATRAIALIVGALLAWWWSSTCWRHPGMRGCAVRWPCGRASVPWCCWWDCSPCIPTTRCWHAVGS
ncbi:MAG: acyltransferase [Microthrixaceae bacterium]